MLAQNSDAPSTAKSGTVAQPDPQPTCTDPPPDDQSETMFPHFKDTRFWLSGQANFIFQTHPPFHAALQRHEQPQPQLRESHLPRA